MNQISRLENLESSLAEIYASLVSLDNRIQSFIVESPSNSEPIENIHDAKSKTRPIQ